LFIEALGLTRFGHITHTLLVDWGACIARALIGWVKI